MAQAPLYPVTVVDTFHRSLSGSWGTTDSGHDWNGDTESRWSTTAGSGSLQMTSNATVTYDAAYVSLGPSAYSETLVKVGFEGAGEPVTDCGPIVRVEATNKFYMARLHNESNRLILSVNAAGVWTNLASISVPLQEAYTYWVRFRADTLGIRAKVWRYGTAEPTSWTAEASYYTGENAPLKGGVGVCARRTTATYTMFTGIFYGYSLDDEYDHSMPINDTFERNIGDGWGVTSDGPVWEGHANEDPRILSPLLSQVLTLDAGDGYGELNHPGDGGTEPVAMIGPSLSNNVEILIKFAINSAVANGQAHIGLKGAYQITNGVLEHTGYALRVAGGSTQFTLHKKTTMGGAYTSITPSATTAYTALTANTIYWVRYQISGSTHQARLWADGAGEPGTWNFTATDSAISSGRAWLGFTQAAGTTSLRRFRVYDYTYSQITASNATTTGALTLVSATTTGMTVRAAYSGDANDDNSIFRYRVFDPSGKQVADDFDVAPVPVASPLSYTITLTDLEPNTTYSWTVEFFDFQGVVGTNPIKGSFSTLATGVKADTLSVTAVAATTVDLKLTYTLDTDNDSSASLEYRTASVATQAVYDTFSGTSGITLQTHASDIGEQWEKHPLSNADDAILWKGRVYFAKPATSGETIYIQSVPSGVTEYEIEADFFVPDGDSQVLIGGRINDTTDEGYYLLFRPVFEGTAIFQIRKYNAGGTNDVLMRYIPDPIEYGTMVHTKFIIHNSYLAVEVDGVEVMHLDGATTYTSNEYVGIRYDHYSGAQGSFPQTAENSTNIDNFSVKYRTYGGSWTSAGSMTASRPDKWFTKQVTGLSSDAIYHFRATISDPDGVVGNTQEFATAMTVGQAVQLSTLTAIPRATSVVVETAYLNDSNNNSSISFQYRALHSLLWTTIPPSLVTTNRGSKKFSTTIPLLRPNTTYEILATISDPNGVVEGTLPTLGGLVTTKGAGDLSEKQTKHFVWKVYDIDENYITTWHDAGDPEFAIHENGGVSDLTVTLPRKLTELNAYASGIAHQNRVDVWTVDPSSNGFGPNLELDPEFELGAWTLGSNADITATMGPDDSDCLRIISAVATQVVTRGNAIYLYRQPTTTGSSAYPLPLVIESIAKAASGKLTMFAEAYDINDVKLDTSDTVDTVGVDWQKIQLEYTPPAKAYYIRVCFRNDNKGTMFADKVSVRPKELLIYRGRIESFTPRIEQDGEDITVEVLGLVSLLSDDYIEFLQFVDVQPSGDTGKPNYGATDPSDIMKKIIDVAKKQNPHFDLYYTAESIRSTGYVVEYTFRDQQIRAALDKTRNLCPPGWHYYIEADGLVNLRGPEHATTHRLRLGVEIMNFSVERSIRNLKNFVEVKGRQDEDESEPDGFGSIKYITFDQASIDRYGKRMLFIRDANITDPDTAELVGNGRLEEYNREEQRALCLVPDEKGITYVGGALKGDNIEKFRPGDNVIILDPVAGVTQTYWDQMIWDRDSWDATTVFSSLPDSVPIKVVQVEANQVRLELSERQPSSVGDFGRLARYLQLKDSEAATGPS